MERGTCDQCKDCPSERPVWVNRHEGATNTAIVLDFPQTLDQAKKSLLNGDAGNIIKQLLNFYGIDWRDCYVTTALNCRPKGKKEALLKKAMFACRDRLIDELLLNNIEQVITFGNVGFSALALADRNLPITKVRGKWYRYFGMNVLPTYNPTMVMGEPDFFRDMCADVEKFASTDGKEPWPSLTLWRPDDLEELVEAFDFVKQATFVSLDVETTGLSAYRDELLAVGLAVLYQDSRDAVSVVIREELLEEKKTWELINELLMSEQATVMHNIKFDAKWLQEFLKAWELPWDPHNLQDSMLLSYCLDERPFNRFKAHALKNLARVRYDAPDYDINMGKWIKEYAGAGPKRRAAMTEDMHVYLALDCYYTAMLYPDLLREVMEEGVDLFTLYETHLLPGTFALMEIEMHGAMIDKPFFRGQWEDLQARAAPPLARVREITGDPEFNPNSPQQVSKYLYTTMGLPKLRTARRGKQQEGPTSKQILKMLKKKFPEHKEAIDCILEYRNLIKNAGTYVKGLLERADDDDRIRSDFLVHGTATGRLSSSNPNLQNIPEKSHTGINIRYGYCAPPGYLLGNADYSQLELRIAAWFSDDENFKAVYIDERDLHQEVAFVFFGKPKEEVSPYERYMAKCMNFGVVYGRGAQSLAFGPEMDYVVDELGGKRWTLEEVSEFFDKFFGNFPQFKQWMDDQYASGYSEQVVISPFGRRRRFPFIPRKDNGAVGRQAVNTPIQGTASDFTLSALIRIHQRFKELNKREDKKVAHIVTTVHDSIMFEFLPAYLEEIREIVRYEMEENLPIKDLPLPFKHDLEIAPRWGLMKDWDIELELPTFLEHA